MNHKYLNKRPDGVIKDVIESFLNERKVLIEPDKIVYISPQEVNAYRILTRTRENSRSGGIRDEYNSRGVKEFKKKHPNEYYDGKMKWDLLMAKMEAEGWKESNPAVIMVRREKKCRLWDGHHRITMALELGWETVPVRFKYREKEL